MFYPVSNHVLTHSRLGAPLVTTVTTVQFHWNEVQLVRTFVVPNDVLQWQDGEAPGGKDSGRDAAGLLESYLNDHNDQRLLDMSET